MKKYLITIAIIIIFVFTIGTIKCQDIFVTINNCIKDSNNIQANNTVSETEKNFENVTDKTDIKITDVRIVIMNSDYSSIYHDNIVINDKHCTIYYGKNFSNQKKVSNDLKIKKDSKLFGESKVIKIKSKNEGIKIDNILRNEKRNSYNGEIYLYSTSGGIVVVNQVDLEKYIAGVVSSEIGEKYPEEALKAQAVCARTFIISKAKNDKYKEFDALADDSTSYQVYNINSPGKKAKKAANDTKGEVITCNNKLINAYYFSTSCGYTTDYKIWGKKKMTYLKGNHITENGDGEKLSDGEFEKYIKNTDCSKELEKDYQFFRWNVKMTLEHMEYSIESYLGYDIGTIQRIEVNKRGAGGIVSNITIYGTSKQISLSNQNEIRKALNPYNAEIKLNDGTNRTNMSILPSAFFTIDAIEKNGMLWGFKIYGGGFGHGSGMSQNGAKELAENGKNYKEIIEYFYKQSLCENIK